MVSRNWCQCVVSIFSVGTLRQIFSASLLSSAKRPTVIRLSRALGLFSDLERLHGKTHRRSQLETWRWCCEEDKQYLQLLEQSLPTWLGLAWFADFFVVVKSNTQQGIHGIQQRYPREPGSLSVSAWGLWLLNAGNCFFSSTTIYCHLFLCYHATRLVTVPMGVGCLHCAFRINSWSWWMVQGILYNIVIYSPAR